MMYEGTYVQDKQCLPGSLSEWGVGMGDRQLLSASHTEHSQLDP